ncbi:MAG: MBL fold metallo-hydrolase [Acidobacteriota bacterium]|nr:MBL fold metallo-hydrolase [Acidobacteriota bacterium]
MSSTPVYLAPNVLAEPLINQWYAWACTYAPGSAAMYVANSHLKIMRGFAAAPMVHVNALKNPAMMGGPFINYPASRVDEIKALIDRTIATNAPLTTFAEAVAELDKLLASEAGGYSLEPLYARIPEALKGYVELVYDRNGQPSARFMEGLLYHSPYYIESNQGVALSTIDKEPRSYVLSTPRLLDDREHLYLPVPFASEKWDVLFRTGAVPRPLGELIDILEIAPGDQDRFSRFFIETPPQPRQPFQADGVRIRYFGHACVLIETRDCSILIDPVLTREKSDIPRFGYQDLPDRIDYLMITHTHGDHCMFETLLALRHKVGEVLVPRNTPGALEDPSLGLLFHNLGFQVRTMEEMARVDLPGGSISALPFLGEHGDLNIQSKSAFLVNLLGKRILLAADSNNLEPKLYDHLYHLTGDVDVLFIGMECEGAPLSWPYGPFLTKPLPRKMDQSRRIDGSDFEKGIKLVEQMHCKRVFVYAMGHEPWLSHLTSVNYDENSKPHRESEKLLQACIDKGIPAERLYGMAELIL